MLLKVAFYFGSSPNRLLQTTLKVQDCVTRKKNVCIAGSHCPLTLFQCLLFLRCFSRVFTKPGMYHFLCTAHHLVDEEVWFLLRFHRKKIITWEKGLGGRGARGCVRTTCNPQKQFGQILYPWFSFEFSGPQPKNWLLCSHYPGRPGLLLEHGGSYRWWLWARCCHHCKGRHIYFSHCPLVTCI